MVLGLPSAHIVSGLTDDRRCGHDIDAVEPGQIRTGHAKQLLWVIKTLRAPGKRLLRVEFSDPREAFCWLPNRKGSNRISKGWGQETADLKSIFRPKEGRCSTLPLRSDDVGRRVAGRTV